MKQKDKKRERERDMARGRKRERKKIELRNCSAVGVLSSVEIYNCMSCTIYSDMPYLCYYVVVYTVQVNPLVCSLTLVGFNS